MSSSQYGIGLGLGLVQASTTRLILVRTKGIQHFYIFLHPAVSFGLWIEFGSLNYRADERGLVLAPESRGSHSFFGVSRSECQAPIVRL